MFDREVLYKALDDMCLDNNVSKIVESNNCLCYLIVNTYSKYIKTVNDNPYYSKGKMIRDLKYLCEVSYRLCINSNMLARVLYSYTFGDNTIEDKDLEQFIENISVVQISNRGLDTAVLVHAYASVFKYGVKDIDSFTFATILSLYKFKSLDTELPNSYDVSRDYDLIYSVDSYYNKIDELIHTCDNNELVSYCLEYDEKYGTQKSNFIMSYVTGNDDFTYSYIVKNYMGIVNVISKCNNACLKNNSICNDIFKLRDIYRERYAV